MQQRRPQPQRTFLTIQAFSAAPRSGYAQDLRLHSGPRLALLPGPNAAQTRTTARKSDKARARLRAGAGQWLAINSFSTAFALPVLLRNHYL